MRKAGTSKSYLQPWLISRIDEISWSIDMQFQSNSQNIRPQSDKIIDFKNYGRSQRLNSTSLTLPMRSNVYLSGNLLMQQGLNYLTDAMCLFFRSPKSSCKKHCTYALALLKELFCTWQVWFSKLHDSHTYPPSHRTCPTKHFS